jgi:hypothetical protein
VPKVKSLCIHIVYGWQTKADNKSLGLRDFADKLVDRFADCQVYFHAWDDFTRRTC